MPAQDTTEIKEKIIYILKKNGPSLPVRISREIESSILFTSAFLSELVSEKRVKISSMRVGSSPIYFLQGQEFRLENFVNQLKSKEKEAFTLLKEKKFLRDSVQDPAIRVALREIKDFAVPFQKEGEIIWRIHNTPQEAYEQKHKPKPPEESQEKELDIFEKKEDKKLKAKKTKKPSKRTSPNKNKFFEKVKEFLSKNSMELEDIESFEKSEISLKIKMNGSENLLVAYNKKRINEDDIIKASKKASELNLPYILLSKGEPLKRVQGLLEAAAKLSSIEKIE